MARRRGPMNADHLRVVGGAPAPLGTPDHPARWARPNVRTVAVVSGRGGAGRSQLAANVSVALAARGARVLLADLDLAQASLDLILGVHPRWDLHHWLRGERTLDELVAEGPSGLRLLAGGASSADSPVLDDWRREVLLRGIGQLDGERDLVVFDLPSGPDALAIAALCDDAVLVTAPDENAVADAYALVKLAHARAPKLAWHLVVGQTTTAEEAEETAARLRAVARRFLQLELESWGAVPSDVALARAARAGEPVVLAFPDAPSSAAYRSFAGRLWEPAGGPSAEPRVPERLEA